MTSPEKKAEIESTLKGDTSVLERAVRALVNAQTDLTGALGELAALDGLETREDVAIEAEHLRTECTNVDALLTEFERTAGESEVTSFRADQDAWSDALYRCQKLLDKAQVKLSRPLPGAETHPPGATGVEAPSPGADGVQATSPSGAPDPSQPTAAAGGSGQGAAVDLSGQVSRLLTLLEARETNAGSLSSASGGGPDSTHAPNPLQCKLPKLEIPKFGGDYLKWYSFWDRFTAAVDCRDRIAPVDKLNYLVGMLENEPLKYIQTLPLTNETYDLAKTMLQSKYGDKKMVVSLLYRRLNEMKTVRNHPAALREFVAEIDCLMGSLGSMGQDVQDDNFATIILSKLPPAVVIMLEMTKEVATDWSVTLVREKLSDYLVRLDRTTKIAANGKGPGHANPYDFTGDSLFAGDGARGGTGWKGKGGKGKGGSKASKANPPPPRTAGPTNQGGSQVRKPWCAFCGGSHYPDNCTRYKTADERFRQVGDRCRLCLKPDHQKSQCQSQKPCYHCKAVGSHHSSMCFNKFGKGGDHSHLASSGSRGGAGDSGGTGGGSGQNGSGSGSGSNSQPPMSLLASGEGVALQTAKIPVQSGSPTSNTFVVTRSLFDPGSNRTYGSRHLARKLKLKTRRRAPLKVNRFGADGAVTIPTETAELRVRQLDGSIVTLEVAIIPQITGSLVRAPVQSQNLERLRTRVRLADDVPTDFEATEIDLLIGNDYYLDFITCEKIEVDPGLYLLGSEFGYILSGRTPLGNHGGHSMSMCAFTCGVLEGLDEVVSIPKADDRMMKKPDMSDLWALDRIGIHDDPKVTSDDLATQNFQQNVKFENGRYWVSLPKNDRAGDLESNFMLSKGRLKSLVTKKLHRDPKLFGAYQEIIADQLAKGVIERVDSSVPTAPVHYIPHHPVVTPQKETTKVRVVYDGSAKVRQDSPSLNDCLHRGPVLLEDMVGLLLRFRTPKYAIVSDIEKAFLQIGIIPEDRDLLRFLWLKDPKKGMVEGNLQVYRFCRVLFGLNCSPSLLLQTVRHHLGLVGTPVAKQISDNLYADNVITGVDSVADGTRFYSEAKGVFRQASMNLRQWSSNSADLMAVIPPEDHIKAQISKVLGLEWNRDTDLLVVSASAKLRNPAATKREFLSQLATVFDPLGFFSPVTVTGKILLQAACESKPDWDTKLSDSSIAEWDEQRKRLLEIPTQPIPRYLPMHGKCMLVAFADASTSSFAAAVYLRTETSEVKVGLLMAKTRLNPVKKLTVPRLELLAILIAVRAINFVATHLSLPKAAGVVFSDSKVALAWLCSQKKQDVFVRNRVKEIAKSSWLKFRYVNTTENPADLPTRGRRATELDSFWWHGPQFLLRPRHEWPNWDTKEVVAQEEEPPTGSIHEMSLVATPDPPLDISRFSSHLRLIRVTAWCLRFRDRAKKMGGSDKCLSAEKLSRAQKLWEIQVQSEAYGSVKEALGQKSHVALGQLSVFQDSEGLLRCRGRMAKADLSWETKFPKLLPKSHPYSRLIVDRIHKEGGHPSVTHTVARVQQKYWIPKGRQLVKSVVHNCVVCRKAAGRAFARPPMPELPASRVVPQPCFTATGVDYFGPLKLRGPEKVEKAWVALFTCLTTRALHLELVPDLSAEQFLLALRRFIARRGKPTSMVSDNGTQFKAVAKTVDVVWNQVLQDPGVLDFAAREGIKWSFIVEYAPNMGGVYERLVGVVKTCLRKTVGSALLTPYQFQTLLCECEATVNTRPLAYVSSDLDDGFVLTPAHFLSLNPRIAVPDLPPQLAEDGDMFSMDSPTLDALVDSWQKGQNLLTEFWRTWKEEYLNLLRERATYRHKKNQGTPTVPRVGEVVLMKEAGVPRGSWRIAKVAGVQQSADGSIRSATVALPSGRELHRPINLLVPMEVVSESSVAGLDRSPQTQNTQVPDHDPPTPAPVAPNGPPAPAPLAAKGPPNPTPQANRPEIILAKLRFYPPWPARVLADWSSTPLRDTREPKDSVAVQFFKTEKFAFVPNKGVSKFDPKLSPTTGRKDLRDAFRLAQEALSD